MVPEEIPKGRGGDADPPGDADQKSSGLNVRNASLADLEQLVSLINGAYRGESGRRGWTTEAELISGQRVDREMIADLLKLPNSYVIVVEDSSRLEASLVGCIHLQSETLETGVVRGRFGMLTVSVERQNEGVGDRLLEVAEAFARERFTATEMSMYVISIRDTLIAWYTRRGYRNTGERAPFPYGDLRFGQPLREDLEFIVMSKRLL
jgi:ribosomal protein S18 acetylase RimI-like enzyme